MVPLKKYNYYYYYRKKYSDYNQSQALTNENDKMYIFNSCDLHFFNNFFFLKKMHFSQRNIEVYIDSSIWVNSILFSTNSTPDGHTINFCCNFVAVLGACFGEHPSPSKQVVRRDLGVVLDKHSDLDLVDKHADLDDDAFLDTLSVEVGFL